MKIANPNQTEWPEPGTGGGPVTVTVSRIARPGSEAEFEQWMAGVCTVASQFEGHQGFTVLRPADRRREYILIFRFVSMQHLRKWNESPARAEWIERARPLTVGDPRVELTTGLEHWFTLPPSAGAAPPPRHKMALLSWVVIFPLILIVSTLLLPYLSGLPWPLPTAMLSMILVVLMTYVVMPRVTRIFSRWLFGG